jgi:hypothetical protein
VLEAEYDVGGADHIMLQPTFARRWRQGRETLARLGVRPVAISAVRDS